MRHVLWGVVGIGVGCLCTWSMARGGPVERSGGSAMPVVSMVSPGSISQGTRVTIDKPTRHASDWDDREPRRDGGLERPPMRSERHSGDRGWQGNDRPRYSERTWSGRWRWQDRDTAHQRRERRWSDWDRRRGREWNDRRPYYAEPWQRRRQWNTPPRRTPFMEPGTYWAADAI